MFSRLARLPLRRSLHTAASAAPTRAFRRPAFALVAGSALATGYFAWSLHTHPVALDSQPETRQVAVPKVHTEPLLQDPAAEPPVPETKTSSPDDGSSGTPTDGGESGESGESTGTAAPTPAHSGGAYNPETGEINWDCPCLGGMAHGPCGEEFKEAFSCFIFSEVEPKGIDCVEKFQAMQNCFRAHPEVYANGMRHLIMLSHRISKLCLQRLWMMMTMTNLRRPMGRMFRRRIQKRTLPETSRALHTHRSSIHKRLQVHHHHRISSPTLDSQHPT